MIRLIIWELPGIWALAKIHWSFDSLCLSHTLSLSFSLAHTHININSIKYSLQFQLVHFSIMQFQWELRMQKRRVLRSPESQGPVPAHRKNAPNFIYINYSVNMKYTQSRLRLFGCWLSAEEPTDANVCGKFVRLRAIDVENWWWHQ